MKLTVIIVNYNVINYLEQCLRSVEKSMEGVETEIFVIDNNSVDGSCNMVRKEFPWVNLIENNENVGFAKANNQAIRQSKGQYILLLNPDTIVEKGTFRNITVFMDENQHVGGLGVKMINGNGLFLAESKRGFPSPEVAFYKMIGLSKLFPRSKRFNAYHKGYLDKNKTHEVEVLSGACMLVRKSVFDKIGLLDETYFMYGEDIDLSYRIIKAGYKNIYFAETTIIHYKGQSTQKGSLNYVILFYKAMKIFAQKYFSKTHAHTFLFFINSAIYLRAAFSLLYRLGLKILYPIVDILLLYAGYTVFASLWGQYKYNIESYNFPDTYYMINVPIYVTIIVMSLFFTSSYRRPVELPKTIKNIAVGVFFTFCIFALLPESLRFSRMMFLVGSIWAIVSIPLSRLLLEYVDSEKLAVRRLKKRRTIIVGYVEECNRVQDILTQSDYGIDTIHFVSPTLQNDRSFIGSLEQLDTILLIHKPDEIIFCEQDIEESVIINSMIQVAGKNIECKIAPNHSHFIVGNGIVQSISNVYTVDNNSLSLYNNRLSKRMFDISTSLFILLLFPILFLLFKNIKTKIIQHCISVLLNNKSWIGYCKKCSIESIENLPKLKPGIIGLDQNGKNISPIWYDKANSLYAKNYSVLTDIKLLFNNFNRLSE